MPQNLVTITEMLAYKIAVSSQTPVIITLKIPDDALTDMSRSNIAVKETAQYRTNKGKVLAIKDIEGTPYDIVQYSGNSTYKLNEIIEEAAGMVVYLQEDVAKSAMSLSNPNHFTLNGTYSLWYCNGHKEYEYSYVGGKLQTLTHFYDDGQLCEKINYADGAPHGLYQHWYKGGNKWEECNYENGEKHGPYESWHWTGQKYEECNYVGGRVNGPYQSWHENGAIWKKCKYMFGKCDGLYQCWFNTGQEYDEATYIDGERHGLYKRWSIDGSSLPDIYYENGRRKIEGGKPQS